MENSNGQVVVISSVRVGFAKAVVPRERVSCSPRYRLQESDPGLQNLTLEATYKIIYVSQPDQVEALADFVWNWTDRVEVIIDNAGNMIQHAHLVEIYNVSSENSLFHDAPLNGAYEVTKQRRFAIPQFFNKALSDAIGVSQFCPGFVVPDLGPERVSSNSIFAPRS